MAHAAANYDYVSFDITGPVDIEITAAEPHFWDRGVDIQPWRLGLRANRTGQTIRFRLASPAKLAIARPRDFLNHAKMLFLFAGTSPPPPPSDPRARIYKPGVYRQSLNPKSGDTILSRARLLLLRRPQSLEGRKRQNSRPRHHRLRRSPGSRRRRGLDAKTRLALRHSLRVASHRGRRPHLHRPFAHLVHPDERLERHRLQRPPRHGRQPRQRQPGRHGLDRLDRRRSPQLLLPRLRRCDRADGQLGRLHRRRPAPPRPRCPEHPDRRQRSLHQHLQHRPRRLAAQDFQLAQLHPAQLRHTARRHRGMRTDLRPARLLGRQRLARRPRPLHL